MKHLDTNLLVSLSAKKSPFLSSVLARMDGGDKFSCSAIAWTEFCNGPCDQGQIETALHILQGRIVPFGREQAEIASRLFNQTGRRRGPRMDCMIAACAIDSKASLITINTQDFERFCPHGLKLANLGS